MSRFARRFRRQQPAPTPGADAFISNLRAQLAPARDVLPPRVVAFLDALVGQLAEDDASGDIVRLRDGFTRFAAVLEGVMAVHGEGIEDLDHPRVRPYAQALFAHGLATNSGFRETIKSGFNRTFAAPLGLPLAPLAD